MGLTNFVSNILSSRQGQRHSQPPQNPPNPTDRLPKPSPQNPPRRRRHQPVQLPTSYKDEWNADWEPEWLFNDEPTTRDFEPRRTRRNNRRPRRYVDEPKSTSSAAFPTRNPLKSFEDDDIPDWQSRPSLPVKDRVDERYDVATPRSRRHIRDSQPPRRIDREDREAQSPRRDDRDGPSSNRLIAWRRRTAGRVKSNIEESTRSHEPATSTRFRNPSLARAASQDEGPVQDSPSLKRLIARSIAPSAKHAHDPSRSPDSTPRIDAVSGSRQIPERDSSVSRDGSLKRGSSGKRDALPRRRGGRIRSNIDQVFRRDIAPDQRSTGRRRLSNMNEVAGYVNQPSLSSSDPISLVNDSYLSPEPQVHEMSRPQPPPKLHVLKSPPARSLQTTPPKPPPLPPSSGKRHMRKKNSPFIEDLGDATPLAQRRSIGEGVPRMRVSAEAVFPPRPRPALPQAFARSQSNPAPPTQPTAPGLKRAHLKRPPPLLTPVNGSPGFALGVGADANGTRGLSMTRDSSYHSDKLDKERRSIDFPATTSAVTEESDFNDMIGPIEGEGKGLAEMDVILDDDAIAEPKAYAKSDIWKTNQSKDDGMGVNRIKAGDILGSNAKLSRKLSDREQELFFFEEASQSSFDTDSPSKIAARNGIIPMDHRANAGEVMEDNFVFGADESFSDGGFIISSDGRVDLPEKVARKMSDGLAVDGVPSSSSNVILVRDLREFRKKYTFKETRSSKKCNPTLGRGAAGKVYLAVHEPSGLKIAVKEINIFDHDKRDQFKKELVTLIGHQSRFLVRSYGAFYGGNGSVHVALEYMDRGALSDIIAQQGPIPEPVVRKIAEHCLRGLAFLHENHILHRDVKTGNILLSRKLCRAKLSDFGLARNFKDGRGDGEKTGDGYSVTHTFVGTVLYMSPERLNGQEYTYASDVWGVGMAILECILGRYPFDKPQSYFDILVSAKSAPYALMNYDDVSDELADFISLATNTDPNQRATARELLNSPWIQMGQSDSNVLRDWLDSLPRLHCQNVEVGSELAFGARKKKEAKAMAKIRAKAKETNRNM